MLATSFRLRRPRWVFTANSFFFADRSPEQRSFFPKAADRFDVRRRSV
jgi:hypothetical protein